MYFTLLILIAVIVPIPVMIAQMKKGTGAYKAVFDGVLAVAAGSVLVFIIASVSGQSLADTLSEDLNSVSELLAGNTNAIQMFGLTDSSAAERAEFFILIYRTAVNTLPAAILIFSTLAAYFEYMLIAAFANRQNEKVPPLPKIKYFSLPRNALFGFIIIFLLSWAFTFIGVISGDILTSNVEVLFEFTFLLQGIGVVFFFFDTKKVPKIVAIIICVMFFMTSIGQLTLFVLGTADLIFGIRQRILQNLHP